jgi:hypothetical protein
LPSVKPGLLPKREDCPLVPTGAYPELFNNALFIKEAEGENLVPASLFNLGPEFLYASFGKAFV